MNMHTARWRRISAAAAAGLIAMSAAGCGNSAQGGSGKTITIGLLGTLTGGTADDGQATLKGAKLAIKELNSAGGVNGYKLKLKPLDTKNQSNDVVNTGVQNLLSDSSVKAVLAGYASTTNFEINSFARAKMVYLLGGGSAQTAGIISKDPDKYGTVWSVTPSYDGYGTGPVDNVNKWIADGKFKPRNKSVYVIESDNVFSQGVADGLKANFEKQGWTVVGSQKVPFGAVNDWGVVLADIRSKNPDFIVNTDFQVNNEITFLNQFLQNPTKSLLFMQYAPTVPAWRKAAGSKGDGVLYNTYGGLIQSPKFTGGAAFVDAYKKEYGTTDVSAYAVIGYEEVKLYADALKKVGDPDDASAIGKAIGSGTTETPSGTMEFDPKTHLAVAGDDFVPLQSFQLQKGQQVLLEPAKYAAGTFTLPPWMQ